MEKCPNLQRAVTHEILFSIYLKVKSGHLLIINNQFTKFQGSSSNKFFFDQHSGSVVEHPLCNREVKGSILGQLIPKTLKMELVALSLGTQR